MSPKNLRCLPLAAAAMVVCMSAQAEYTFADGKLRLSGFGTVGVSRTNNDQAYFNYPGQGGGADRSASFDPDSKLGLQGTYKFTDTLSATAQLLTKYRATGEYKPEFEWAFAKWQATPSTTVRLGRIGAPFFTVSDFRDVGYANTTVRPPLDVYGQVPVSSVDGGDISYQANVGSATVTSTLWGGQTKVKYASALRNSGADLDPILVKLRNQLGLNLQAEFDGGYTLRFGHSQSKLSLETSSLGTLRSGLSGVLAGGLGAGPQALANQMLNDVTTTGQKATFTGLGASMDRDNIVLATEYTWRTIDKGAVADTTGWYVLGGYRFGTVLPYVVVSRLTVDDLNTSLNPQASALGAAYRGAQGLVNNGKVAQNTLSVGTRWDFRSGMALKAQFDRISKPSGSNGLFLNPDAATASGQDFFNNKKKVNVLSLAVDFVF
ncbi:hypothetical protein [Aquabacterium sp.]|jgi:hypothetical protein|uniref:hypothetical protein n=1 Tax=Aquabacterium sp. TaxID=1872578 RepID=UPI002489BB65|nr:hypothetical protein [Aquabacterium sp.]MDI1349734.1 hypothetical protein [Aquabacterium sp.]